ncbi:MAG: hypothetical protein Q8Q31_04835 [Nanoarchaeota archaeon]|nr:hypothetical protein [Nanoarchaeota archaeon]
MKLDKRKASYRKKINSVNLALYISFGVAILLLSFNFVSLTGQAVLGIASSDPNFYVVGIHYSLSDGILNSGERIELKGSLFLSNYTSNGTLVSSYAPLPNAAINITIRMSNGTYYSNHTLTTDANGSFYSRSNYYTVAPLINAPVSAGNYFIRAQYNGLSNRTSELNIQVMNKTLDVFRISSEKAKYNPGDSIVVTLEAVKLVGDKELYISNVTINGTFRNSTKAVINNFNCTTGSNGQCAISFTAPSKYGSYKLEAGQFKSFSTLEIVPFSFRLSMKDELGESDKHLFAVGEQARVAVQIVNTSSSSDQYSFSGYIRDSNLNVIKIINSTNLSNNNSFTNSFLFTVDSLTFNSYGTYFAYVNVSKAGGSSASAGVSFRVQDWKISSEKKSTNSGFEYEYSAFTDNLLRFETYPRYSNNGSIIANLSAGLFTVALKDQSNNVLNTTTVSWNASCGKEGCYEFSITAPNTTGKYNIYTILSYSGSTQTDKKVISVIDSVMSAQATDKDGNLKELFGAKEYAYISLSAYNLSNAQYNLSEAEIFSITYTNGSKITYTNVSNFDSVNSSDSVYQWAWNSTLQRIKLETPHFGGLYNVYVFGNNKTLGANSQLIVNPYDSCIVSKNTPGQVSGSGYYYVWQFKTSDTIYFDLKLTQANNPLGKATALNSTNSSAYGMGSACTTDSTKQVVNNATLTILEVKNSESGEIQQFNTTESTCQSSDSSGGYSCTLKPASKWSGGIQNVKFSVVGNDGTTSTFYGKFEARAFYLYGWTSTWQNNPNNNISLNLRLYEAGTSYWSSSGSSGGVSGTVTLKKVEYMGGDGEWIWPPVDAGYNASNVNSTSISTGAGTLTIPVSSASGGTWKTGNYRAVLQATTSAGDSDYGYAWFGVKLWDVYGTPIECTSYGCNYKNYFNSRENVTLYIRINKAGNYNDAGGQDIYGNVSISVKKIQDCRKWPCTELNASKYAATTIIVNSSSPYYSSATLNQTKYMIRINTTTGSWGSGYYSVVLNVNGTDTGSAWFNTIAFYADAQPVHANGTTYRSSIRNAEPAIFNITTTKAYKSGFYATINGSSVFNRYNISDYVNVTIDDVVIRSWDYTTNLNKEYNYPEDLNVTSLTINGNKLINLTLLSGDWPTGYYYGDISLKSLDNETSSAWMWFNAQPFRVQLSSNTYNADSTQCVNASLFVYEPDWTNNQVLVGNYSIAEVYETVWSGSSSSKITYTNYSSSSFSSNISVLFCPNSGAWGSGSWGGYHYLNVVVRDRINNLNQTGWLSFRAVPFQVTWGSVYSGTSKQTNQNIIVNASLNTSSGASASGNLTKLYQWRYDNSQSTLEEYVFKVGSCYSNVSGQCTITGTSTITIYAPSNGWRVGYNNIYATWTSATSSSSIVDDYGGIYIEGRAAYSGSFDNVDSNGNWKYYFAKNDNLTIRLNLKDLNLNSADATVTNVHYALSSDSCFDEWCRTYSSANWEIVGGGTSTTSGKAILRLIVPSSNWTKGTYYIKASVSGSNGTATITGGYLRVKDMTPPNVTVSSPTNNITYTTALIPINFTTDKSSQCTLYVVNYNNFNNWYCGSIVGNSSNSTNSTASAATISACNTSYYGFNGTRYYTNWISNNYYSSYDGQNSTWYSASTGLNTGGTTHSYMLNVTRFPAQHYSIQTYCQDSDYNSASEWRAIKVNVTS